jgi:hypothetical protein
MRRPALYISDILRWADEFHRRKGRWPHRNEGTVDLTWRRIDSALKLGNRGLPRGSSLAKLLLARRNRRHKGQPPTLSEYEILNWADAHRRRTGEWPVNSSGQVHGVPGETWSAVDHSLRIGRRGLPGGSALAQLLEARRSVRTRPRGAAPAVIGLAQAPLGRPGCSHPENGCRERDSEVSGEWSYSEWRPKS